MTTIKLESQTISNLSNYLTELKEGLNNALLNISFNENEIKRLTGELEQAKARYMMTRSKESKQEIENLEKKIEDVQKELKLDYTLLASENKRYSIIELSKQEYEDITSDINAFMKPVQDKKVVIYQKIDELLELVEDYSAEYEVHAEEVGLAISIVNQTCTKGTHRKIAVYSNIDGLKIETKLRDVLSAASESRSAFF